MRITRTISNQLLLWLTLLIFGSGQAIGKDPVDQLNEHSKKGLYVIGHRGAAGLAPENTLAAFRRAFELGVDAVELDVQLSADGIVAVYHDLTLKPEITRTPDGEWLDMWKGLPIKDLSLDELKTYDVGRLKPQTPYARRYPDQTPADGERIPTLQEVIELIRNHRHVKTQLWVEIKTSPEKNEVSGMPETVAKAVVKLLHREDFSNRTKILSFDWRSLVHVQKIAPNIQTVYLSTTSIRSDTIQAGRSGSSPWTAGIDVDNFNGSIPRAIKAAGGGYWAPRYNQITPKLIKEAHQLGIPVFVWTVDSRHDMVRLMKMGVDGIITNRPDILKTVLNGS